LCREVKGTVSLEFLLQVFFINNLPPALENNTRVFSIFSEIRETVVSQDFIWMVFYFLSWLLRILLVVFYLYRVSSSCSRFLLYSFFESIIEKIAVQDGTSEAAGEKA
jgi:hypothetical protein